MKILLITGLVILYILIGLLLDAIVVYKLFSDTWGPIMWLGWPLMIVVSPIIGLMTLFVYGGDKIVEWIQDIFKV
jgi:hypothetical protein